MKIDIHRSATDRVIAGVMGVIAKTTNNSRVTLVFQLKCSAIPPMFPGIIAYLILWLLMKDPIKD